MTRLQIKSEIDHNCLIIKAITPLPLLTHSTHRETPLPLSSPFNPRQSFCAHLFNHRQSLRWRSKNTSSCSLQPSKKCLLVLALRTSAVMNYLSYTLCPTFPPIVLSNPSFAMHGGWNVHLLTHPYLSLFPTSLQLALLSLSLYVTLSLHSGVLIYRVYGGIL